MRVNSTSVQSMYQSKSSATSTKGTGFSETMAGVNDKAAMNTLVSALSQKYGMNITVEDLNSGSKALENNIKNTTGHGNVVISSNILEEMINDPEKLAHYEKMLREHNNWASYARQSMNSEGKSARASGIIIHPDGTMSEWIEEGSSIDDIKLSVRLDSKMEDGWWAKSKEQEEQDLELQRLMEKKKLDLERA